MKFILHRQLKEYFLTFSGADICQSVEELAFETIQIKKLF